MANPYASNPLETFASAITDYIARHNRNVSRITTVGTTQDERLEALEAGGLLAQADAANNIPNMIVNGDFRLGYCGPKSEADSFAATIPSYNSVHGTYSVKWADCWFFKPSILDGLEVRTKDDSATTTPNGFLGQMLVMQGPTTSAGPFTGTIFQRLEYFYDLTNIRGKTFRFSVLYDSDTDDEFYLEIDDGVTTSDNATVAGGPSPSGAGVSTVTHVVDGSATQLTVKIVLLTDASSSEATALKILYAHGRLGVGTFNLLSEVPPPKQPAEIFLAQMMSVTLELEQLYLGQTLSGGTERASHICPLRIPLLSLDSDDVEEAVYIAGSGGDSRDIDSVNVTVTPFVGQERAYGPNNPGSGVDYLTYETVGVDFTRTVSIAPATGFFSALLAIFFRAIPDLP